MIPLGNTILVHIKPREKVRNGIIIPDTATLPSQEWGEVSDGNGIVPNGSRILYFGGRCFKAGNMKLVPRNKIIIWE